MQEWRWAGSRHQGQVGLCGRGMGVKIDLRPDACYKPREASDFLGVSHRWLN